MPAIVLKLHATAIIKIASLSGVIQWQQQRAGGSSDPRTYDDDGHPRAHSIKKFEKEAGKLITTKWFSKH